MENFKFVLKEITKKDRQWVRKILQREWGSVKLVSRAKVYNGESLPGFIAYKGTEYLGLVTYNTDNKECEIVSLNSFFPRQGVGSALITKVKEVAILKGCQRIYMITTDNNIEARNFYQNRGFTLKNIYKNAILESRKLKPEIPFYDENGRLIKDEVEMELVLI